MKGFISSLLIMTATLNALAQTGNDVVDRVAIPRKPVPESVFQIFRTVIEELSFDPQAASANLLAPGASEVPRTPEGVKSNNLASWQALRHAPWPDYTMLKRVSPDSSRGETRSPYGNLPAMWVFESPDKSVLELLPDLSERKVYDSTLSSLRPINFSNELSQAVLGLARQSRSYQPSFGSLAGEQVGKARVRETAFSIQMHQAYAAAVLGHTNEGRALFRGALQMNAQGLAQMAEDHRQFALASGRRLLEAGQPRSDVLSQWQIAERMSRTGAQAKELADYNENLQRQVAEFGRLLASEVENPESLLVAERAAYYAARFTEIRSPQSGTRFNSFAPRENTPDTWDQKMVRLGFAAIPALLERLDDRRLTRSIEPGHDVSASYSRSVEFPHVLRVQDFALTCLELILEMPLRPAPRREARVVRFSSEPADLRTAVVADLRAWWSNFASRPLAEGRLARLSRMGISDRVAQLRKIEQADKQAVDSVALLKSWVIEAAAEETCTLAQALCQRGDFSLLPLVRQLSEEGLSNCGQLLHEHGDAGDVLRAYQQERLASGSAGQSPGRSFVLSQIFYETDERATTRTTNRTNRLWLAALLVEGLTDRTIDDTLYQNSESLRCSFADKCLLRLTLVTGHDAGTKLKDPPEARFAAMDRWLAWWKTEGASAFAAKYPEARVLIEAGTNTVAISAEELPPILSVSGSGSTEVRYRIPRAQGMALVSSGDIAATRTWNQPSLRFRSIEAARQWFAQARPVPGPTDISQTPLQRVGAASLRGPVVAPNGAVWFSQPQVIQTKAAVRTQVEAALADPNQLVKIIKGAEIVLVDRNQRVWLVTSLSEGTILQGFDPRTREWTERKAQRESGAGSSSLFGSAVARMIPSAYESRGGTLYFAASSELHILHDGQWSVWPCPDPWPVHYTSPSQDQTTVLVTAEDAQNRVLIWTRPKGLEYGKAPNCWAFQGNQAIAMTDTNVSAAMLPVPWRRAWSWPRLTAMPARFASASLTTTQAWAAALPNLRFREAILCGHNQQGTEFFALESVTSLEPLGKSRHRLILVPPEGPVLDLGSRSAEKFYRNRGDCFVALDGALWVTDAGTLIRVDARGNQRQFPISADEHPSLSIRGSDRQGRLYFADQQGVWQLDPARTNLLLHSGTFIPTLSARQSGRVWGDSLGGAWYATGSVPAALLRSEKGQWTTVKELQTSSPGTRGFIQAYDGTNGTMIFRSETDGVVLCDAQGTVEAGSLSELVQQHTERLRAAIPYPPSTWKSGLQVFEANLLFTDTDQNIWVTDSKNGFSVWHSNRWLTLNRNELGSASSRRVRPTLLSPVGDGRQVVWSDFSGHAELVTVRSGQIEKLRDWPALGQAARQQRNTPILDHEGRLWIAKEDRSIGFRIEGDPQTHPGHLFFRDRQNGLWFYSSGRTQPTSLTITRLDPTGAETSVSVEGLEPKSTGAANPNLDGFCEAPDESVWLAAGRQLVRVALRQGQLLERERHFMGWMPVNQLWCESGGRVWASADLLGVTVYAVAGP